VLEMCDESRAHFHQQGFEFLVRCAWNQGAVERIDNLLVVRHFSIELRVVECGASERLQMGEALLTIGFQALAG
jgi:hypothetical protein